MKASINSPVTAQGSNSYQLECQFALEPTLVGLIDVAERAGWDRSHVYLALMHFASQRINEAAFPAPRNFQGETH